MSKRYKLSEVTKSLAAAAQGIIKADTVIKNTTLVNVNTGEIIENTDIAIVKGRIALVGFAAHTIGEETKVYDAKGQYAAPGFMDGHIHVESSMMPVRGYAKAVVPRGTTAIFADPHEIGNVFGTKGVKFMLDDAETTPLRFFAALPSCVPAVEKFEDAGATITPEDIAEMLELEAACGLGEVMNFPGVLAGDDKMHEEIRLTLEKNKIVTGHYSVPETGKRLNGYIATGVRCDHETTRKEAALAKMRLGMYVQIREGSAWRDLTEVIRAVTETKIDTRYTCLVTDDSHADTLIEEGHLDHLVRRAIDEGVDPITAIQMVTLNVAQCYGVDRDLGSISPGRVADLVLFSNLKKIDVNKVFINGELVAEDGKLCVELEEKDYPDWVKKSMNIGKALAADDFVIPAPDFAVHADSVMTKTIEVFSKKIATIETRLRLPVSNGKVTADLSQDVCKATVIERHHATGTKASGFVKGFGLKSGAVASTVSHDCHNLLVIGTNDGDMALAANTLVDSGGGLVAVSEGKILALLPLPIAGLMSDEPADVIVAKNKELDKALIELGCELESPFMNMAFLPLPVIPELRLTNRGLVDTNKFELTNLFIELE